MSGVQVPFPLFYLLAFLAQLDRATVFVRFIMIFKVEFGFFKIKKENLWINFIFRKRLVQSRKNIGENL
jgi:hypothetical protein